jgi:DNA end-binding protein Ku
MHLMWKGSLTFGLVNIPVRLYSATAQKELKFKMLHKKDLSEIRYARICKAEKKEVAWEDIVKGYEYERGNFVVLTEEDFEKANPKKTRTIEILDFTAQDQIDTIYYDTPYYLEPEKSAAKGYTLLYEALKASKKIAIGRFIFHHHEHLGVIRPYKNILLLNQLRFHNEMTSLKELKVPKVRFSKSELDLALNLIDGLTKPFKPEKYSDSFKDEIKALIKKKAKGQRIAPAKRAKSAKVRDISSLLKASLKKSHKKRKAA